MTSDRLKNLAKLRLVLSVIAVLLVCTMVVSGVMIFRLENLTGPAEKPAVPEVETGYTVPAETEETAEETASVTEDTTATTEPEETQPAATEPTQCFPHEEGLGPAVLVGVDDRPGTNGDSEQQAPSDGNSKPVEPTKPSTGDPGDFPGNSNTGGGTGNTGEDTGNTGEDTGNTGEDTGNTGEDTENAGSNEEITNVLPAQTAPSSDSATGDVQIEPDVVLENLHSVKRSEEMQTMLPGESAEAAETKPRLPMESTDNGNGEIPEPEEQYGEVRLFWGILFWVAAALLALDLIAIAMISNRIVAEQKRLRRVRRSLAQTDEHAGRAMRPVRAVEQTQLISTASQVGKVHQMGRRDYQQDSLGHTAVLDDQGILAVLADGMGGLSGGEKVSQKIVMDALAMGHQLKAAQVNGVLWKMTDKINENINRMLGSDGLYKSGSTLVMVLVYDGKFQWITVGDSRIYLYREGYANQLNQDHDQLQFWMADVLSGRRTMEEVIHNPDGRKLTSFIGMGQLKYVDGSRNAISLEPGDRIVLMSDGIYSIISEEILADILKKNPDVDKAATVIEKTIRNGNHPHQDNYTAIILGF